MDSPRPDWETVIGLEVHVQIATASKMYCACPAMNTQELAQANQYVCPVCLGHPGTLPRPNRQAVVRALTLARKVGAEPAPRSVFARKNYFYPDLPKGYQISQYDLPLASGGALQYWHNGEARRARLVRLHLEEDTAKLFHETGSGDGPSPSMQPAEQAEQPKAATQIGGLMPGSLGIEPQGRRRAVAATGAFLDFNRSGIPLLEIVTEPDFRSGAECVSYLTELRSLLRRLGVSDAAMELGNFRCEPNVSVRPVGEAGLRTKTELKNLNSFATLRRAVEAEVARQVGLYESGGRVEQATLRFDPTLGATVPMRRKETADDYRYFDDPDIPPLVLKPALLEEAEAFQADSEFEVRGRLVEQGLAHEHAATIAGDDALSRFYTLCIADDHDPREVAKWVTGELSRLLREAPLGLEPGELSAVLTLLREGKLTLMQAREVFEAAYRGGDTVESIVAHGSYSGPQTDDELRSECLDVIAGNPKVVADIRGGKVSAMQVLVGQVLKRTRGAVKPEQARALLEQLLAVEPS